MTKQIKAFGEVMMRLEAPQHRTLSQTNRLDVSYSGTGVNVLSALARYGYETSLITKLPTHSIGDAAVAYLRGLGISTADITRGGDHVGMYFLENGFSVRPSKVTYGDRTLSSFCTSTEADYDLNTLLHHVDVLHFCGIVLAISEQTRTLAIHMAKRAKQLGIHLVFDCNYRPKLWARQQVDPRPYYETMLELADTCFMTEKDAAFLLDQALDSEAKHQQIEALIPEVQSMYSIETIAGTIRGQETDVTQTMQGFLYRGGNFSYSKIYEFEIFDRIGAGDGFASGVLYGDLTNLSEEETVEFATAASVLAHTTYGDSPICTAEDVWQIVNNKYRSRMER